MTLKIVIDWELCESNFVCNDSCSDLFLIDEENDKLIVAQEIIPQELETEAESACRRCPKGAITLQEG